MNALELINASEVTSHRLTGLPTRQFGPLLAVGSGQNTPLDSAWHDGTRVPTAQELNELESFCQQQGQPVTIHALSHVAPELLPGMRSAGYTVSYLLHVYAHNLRHLPPQPDLLIQPEPDPHHWAQLSAQGFGPGSSTIMQLVAQHSHVQRFTAMLNHQPAGTAAMQLHTPVAALYGTSTLPHCRQQGVQTALLAHRLHAASTQGAALASVFVTPNTPSERNIVRAGFQLVGMRLTFSR